MLPEWCTLQRSARTLGSSINSDSCYALQAASLEKNKAILAEYGRPASVSGHRVPPARQQQLAVPRHQQLCGQAHRLQLQAHLSSPAQLSGQLLCPHLPQLSTQLRLRRAVPSQAQQQQQQPGRLQV